jgi:hypothetical protein
MGRVIGAAIAGYVAIGILVVCTDQVYALLVPGFKSLPMPPTYYFALSLLTDFIYSILGGYLCAWIAGALARKATLGLIVGGEILGVVSVIVFWNSVPHWFGFGLLILYPPAVWLGSKVFLSRDRSEPRPKEAVT